jgi:hypothetical protein
MHHRTILSHPLHWSKVGPELGKQEDAMPGRWSVHGLTVDCARPGSSAARINDQPLRFEKILELSFVHLRVSR